MARETKYYYGVTVLCSIVLAFVLVLFLQSEPVSKETIERDKLSMSGLQKLKALSAVQQRKAAAILGALLADAASEDIILCVRYHCTDSIFILGEMIRVYPPPQHTQLHLSTGYMTKIKSRL